jgi:Fic family protein
MIWNWEQPSWPEFTFDPKALEALEQQFLLGSGEFIGVFKHIGLEDQDVLRIELISDQAQKTSEIEGELLNRQSVQSSLRQQFGLGFDQRRIPPAARGVGETMVNLYQISAAPLTHDLAPARQAVMSFNRFVGDVEHEGRLTMMGWCCRGAPPLGLRPIGE